MNQVQNIDSLLAKPLWQLSSEEFCELIRYANSSIQKASDSGQPSCIQYAYGIHDLGMRIGCCDSTIYQLRKQGVLDDAIISQIGKKIVFNVDIARKLAEEYQQEQRASRHGGR